jgi:hypothetical protein
MRIKAHALSLCVVAILFVASPARAQKPAGVTSPGTSTPAESQASNTSSLPTAAAYSRPTGAQKWSNFAHEAIGPYTLLKTLAVAGVLQAQNSPPDWGQGASGFGDRVGSEYGRFLAETGSKYVIAAALRQDTKYYRCECSGIGHRVRHAVISTFSARAGDDGHRIFSPAPIVAPYIGGFTQLAWYPSRFSYKDGFRFGNYGLLYDVGANLAREFISAKF